MSRALPWGLLCTHSWWLMTVNQIATWTRLNQRVAEGGVTSFQKIAIKPSQPLHTFFLLTSVLITEDHSFKIHGERQSYSGWDSQLWHVELVPANTFLLVHLLIQQGISPLVECMTIRLGNGCLLVYKSKMCHVCCKDVSRGRGMLWYVKKAFRQRWRRRHADQY